MNKLMKAYMLKGRRTVMTDKTLIMNTKEDEFEEVTLILSREEIDRYSKELQRFSELEEERLQSMSECLLCGKLVDTEGLCGNCIDEQTEYAMDEGLI